MEEFRKIYLADDGDESFWFDEDAAKFVADRVVTFTLIPTNLLVTTISQAADALYDAGHLCGESPTLDAIEDILKRIGDTSE